MFSSGFSDQQDSDSRGKNNDFLVEHSSTSVVSPIEILLDSIERVVDEK